MQPTQTYTSDDFAHSPFVMFYELTRACDLLCRHCRACAQRERYIHELNTEQSRALLSQIATFPKPPVLIFTGGDPMKRSDVYDLVEHAGNVGLTTAMTPSATPLVTREALKRLKDAGVSRLAISLDGLRQTHDSFRGVPGSFERTMEIISDIREIGLPLQINTTITRHNFGQIDCLANLVASIGAVLWSVFFLVPVGRGLAEERIEPAEYEIVFEKLFRHSLTQPYGIKTTEAPQYRRFVLEREGDPRRQPEGMSPGRIHRAPLGVNDGKGSLFVSHTGAIYPTGFLPIKCGKFPEDSVVEVYQNSPVFLALRDSEKLKGKCGRCEYRTICGGSRARAYAITRDLLAAEPDCLYQPKSGRAAGQISGERYAQCQ